MKYNNIDLEKYYLIKQQNFKEIELYFKNKSSAENEVIYCKIKCPSCCIGYLIGPEIEVELLLMVILKNEYITNIFLKNYKKYLKNLIKINDIILKINSFVSNEKYYFSKDTSEYKQLISKYISCKINCPFLYKKKCLVYPARPYVCANICSFSKSKYCSKNSLSRKVIKSDVPPAIPNFSDDKIKFFPIISELYSRLNQDLFKNK